MFAATCVKHGIADPMAGMTTQIVLTSWHLLTTICLGLLKYVFVLSLRAHQVLEELQHRPVPTADLQCPPNSNKLKREAICREIAICAMKGNLKQ